MNNAEQKFHVGDLVNADTGGWLGLITNIDYNSRANVIYYLVRRFDGTNHWYTYHYLSKAH